MPTKYNNISLPQRVLFLQNNGDPLLPHRDSLIYVLSIFGAVCFFPFGINYLVAGRIDLVVLVFIAVSIFLINAVSLHFNMKPMLSLAWLLLPFCWILEISLNTIGIYTAFWCFPAILLFYFVLSRKQAHGCCIILLLLGTWLLYDCFGVEAAVRYFLAVVLCMISINIVFNIIVHLQEKLIALSIRDPLTDAFNRRHMEICLSEEIERFRRSHSPASLLLFDIDNFKAINDEYGHAAGDLVLIDLVKLVATRSRKLDVLFRIGGEEFLLLLPETKLADAMGFAEELRMRIEQSTVANLKKTAGHVTVSMGVAELRRDDFSDQWLKRADDAMYRAKESGRNQICGEHE